MTASDSMRRPDLIAVHPCDENHQVLTLKGDEGERYRREPCTESSTSV